LALNLTGEVTMADPILVAKSGDTELALLPALANRHCCITGATGTGKTITLQVLAEGFSRIGVPVFMADVKGDLTGITRPGKPTPKLQERLTQLSASNGFEGRVVLIGDDAMGESDCRVEWADGGVEREAGRIWRAVEEALARYIAVDDREAK